MVPPPPRGEPSLGDGSPRGGGEPSSLGGGWTWGGEGTNAYVHTLPLSLFTYLYTTKHSCAPPQVQSKDTTWNGHLDCQIPIHETPLGFLFHQCGEGNPYCNEDGERPLECTFELSICVRPLALRSLFQSMSG